MTGFNSSNVQMWATIGNVTVDVVLCHTKYAPNTIPTATLLLPPGTNVTNPIVGNPAPGILNQVVQSPIRVFVNYRTIAESGPSLNPDGEYTLFWGWVTSAGYRRVFNHFGLVIECTHWLSALNFSSIFSEGLAPSSPFQFLFPATVTSTLGGSFLFAQNILSDTDPSAITKDFWGSYLLPWFQALVTRNILKIGDTGNKVGQIDNTGCMSTALSMFQGGPLPMNLSSVANGPAILTAIQTDLGAISTQTNTPIFAVMSNSTLWDTIVGHLAPRYLFSIIPYPTRAKVVPFTPGLRTFWDPSNVGCTIWQRDTVAVDRTNNLPRPIRAVALTTGVGSTAGCNIGDTNNQIAGGLFPADPSQLPGMVIVRNAPRWLCEVPTNRLMGFPQGLNSGSTSNALGPNLGSSGSSTNSVMQQSQDLLDKFAHLLYITEVLRNRTGKIAGPLRFDICPGSTICFESPPGTFGAQGPLMYATVVEVAHFLDAPNRQVNTTFTLDHIRSSQENSSDLTSIAQHPLYNATWPGDYFV